MAKRTKKNKKRGVVRLVRKSNDLVEAKYKFDIWETRVFTKMLTMVRMDDADFKDYRIYLTDIIDEYNLKSNKDAYQWLKRGARKLMTKIITVVRETDEGPMEFHTPIAVGVENPLNVDTSNDEMSFIDVSFHPKMKPYLLALKSKFTTYDVQNILKLPSAYSIRIYELLKQYERIGKRKFEIQELKEIIGVIEEVEENGKKKLIDSYPLYGNFRQRVLLKAQKDLEKYTDIKFEFEPIKRGRKTHSILFYIISNTKESSKKPELIETIEIVNKSDKPENSLINDLYPKVKIWSITKRNFEKWLKKWGEEKVKESIRAVENQIAAGKEISNPGGLFFHLLQQPTLFDAAKIKKEQHKAKKAATENRVLKKQNLEQQLRQLESEKHQKEVAIIEAILIEMPEVQDVAIEKIKAGIFAAYWDDSKNIDENLKNQVCLTAFRNAIKKEFSSRFERLQKSYQPKIDDLKLQVAKI